MNNPTNRSETHKLYCLLLPFSLYNNPYKLYSRKMKIKRQPPSLHGSSVYSSLPISSSGTIPTSLQLSASDLMIVSSYYNPGSTSASGSTSSSASASATIVRTGPSMNTRKKMKHTFDNQSEDYDANTIAQQDASSSTTTSATPKSLGNALTNDDNDNSPASNIIILKSSEFEKIKIGKYSLTDLRTLCSHYGIKKSGTKPELVLRIYSHLKQSYFIVKIQRKFREYISGRYRSLCGPGYLHISKCVNDTDFYTFDKLSNILPQNLFTYLDKDGKVYGFHIASIFHLIISSYPDITNPYNRNIIPSKIIQNVYEKLIYGTLLQFRVSIKLDDVDDDEEEDTHTVEHANIVGGAGAGAGMGAGAGAGSVSGVLSREKQEELFIVDLFQHINTLGNYSDSEWFMALQRIELIRFIRNIYDIWYYRANLSQEMKERICPPNGNPFMLNNASVNLSVISLLNDAEIRTICVSVIDRMVRRGVSREDQCLGAFYVLATLTIVNQDARNALPWLYDAVL